MNKKIKLIELLQKSANKEELPKKIYFDRITFELDKYGTYKGDGDLLVDSINFDLSNLKDYVEILEDNTEEIEEKQFIPLNLQLTDYDKDLINSSFKALNDSFNELVKAINQMRKEKE